MTTAGYPCPSAANDWSFVIVAQLRLVSTPPSARPTAADTRLAMTPSGHHRYATRGPSASASGLQSCSRSGCRRVEAWRVGGHRDEETRRVVGDLGQRILGNGDGQLFGRERHHRDRHAEVGVELLFDARGRGGRRHPGRRVDHVAAVQQGTHVGVAENSRPAPADRSSPRVWRFRRRRPAGAPPAGRSPCSRRLLLVRGGGQAQLHQPPVGHDEARTPIHDRATTLSSPTSTDRARTPSSAHRSCTFGERRRAGARAAKGRPHVEVVDDRREPAVLHGKTKVRTMYPAIAASRSMSHTRPSRGSPSSAENAAAARRRSRTNPDSA